MNPDRNRFEPLREPEKLMPDNAQPLEKLFERAMTQQQSSGDPSSLVRADGSPVPEHWPIFKVGEELVVKNYVFRVAYIGETTLLLEPVRMAP